MPDASAASQIPSMVIFRADASPEIGGGHIMRCAALAQALASRGATIAFIVGCDTVATWPALADSGYRLVDAQGATTLADTLLLMGAQRDSILVVDHYGISPEEVSACRVVVDRIVVIDDLAAGPNDSDLVLNQNTLGPVDLYAGLLPAHAKVLSGPNFSLLRPTFPQLRAASLTRRQSSGLQRVFVSFGLTDVGGWALWVAQTLANGPFEVDIAIGAAAVTVAPLLEIAQQHANIHLHIDAGNVASLMAEADIAIGGGGSSSWERCCLGLPSFVAVVAENQRPIVEALHAAGAAILLTEQDRQHLPELLADLQQNPERLRALQRSAASICDGLGSQRVADAVLSLPQPESESELVVRPSVMADCADFWFIRNNFATRSVSGESTAIPWNSHVAWWQDAIVSPQRLLLSAEFGGRIIGYVRFDLEGTGDYVTSIALAPRHQGRGFGGQVLRAGLDVASANHASSGFIARIQQSNIVSINMFERCDFVDVGQEQDFRLFRRAPRSHET